MTELFTAVIDMSLTAAMAIVCVLAVRLLLRDAPKIWSYSLWSVVLFRLLCPISLSIPMAPLELLQPRVTASGDMTSYVSYVSAAPTPFIQASGGAATAAPEAPALSPMDIGAWLWLCGVGIMVLYSCVTYLRLRRELVGAMRLEGNVYIADRVSSPFVLGVVRPKIYLPSHCPARERSFILAHERHHIRRGDHILKLLGWVALCIHWFDPLVWVAFFLAGRDMEMSCDEAVIKKLGSQVRADYSQTLLRLATGERTVAFSPLAFGEGDTKGRVLNMAKWKRPRLWISLVCAAVSLAVLAACAVNPGASGAQQLHAVQGAVEFGHLTMAVPGDYLHGDSNRGGVAIYEEEIPVGGIERYALPPETAAGELDPHELGVAAGVPDALEDNLAYMGSSSAWADLEIEYFDELDPDRLNNSHYYYISGLNVYDVWFDNNQVSQDTQIAFLSSVQLAPPQSDEGTAAQHHSETEPAQALGDEAEAMEKCRAVVEMVQQSGSYWIESEKTNEGGNVINPTSHTSYLRSGEDWLTMFQIPESGIVDGVPVWFSMFAYMEVDGSFFTNEGNGMDEQMRISWSEGSPKDVATPWLASFRWEEDAVRFISRVPDGAGESVLLQIDAPNETWDDAYPSYTVSFWFDGSGAFRYVEVRAAFREEGAEDYHFLDRESIYTLDEAAVSRQIQEEYSRATG